MTIDSAHTHQSDIGTGAAARRFPFLRQALRHPRTVGAIAPSGNALARRLTEPLTQMRGGRALNVLEVGAGTGAVTRIALSHMAGHGRLDIVETNPRFAAELSRIVNGDRESRLSARSGAVHCTDIERFDTDIRYDVIISGLPVTNFEPEQVTAILERFDQLLADDGTLTYFSYRGTYLARRLFSSDRQARRHHTVEQLMSAYRDNFSVVSTPVWKNLPHATAWQLQRPLGSRHSRAAVPSRRAAGESH